MYISIYFQPCSKGATVAVVNDREGVEEVVFLNSLTCHGLYKKGLFPINMKPLLGTKMNFSLYISIMFKNHIMNINIL